MERGTGMKNKIKHSICGIVEGLGMGALLIGATCFAESTMLLLLIPIGLAITAIAFKIERDYI